MLRAFSWQKIIFNLNNELSLHLSCQFIFCDKFFESVTVINEIDNMYIKFSYKYRY